MTIPLIVLAVVVGIVGVVASSQATFGVALIGFACLLGILARIAQAARVKAGPEFGTDAWRQQQRQSAADFARQQPSS